MNSKFTTDLLRLQENSTLSEAAELVESWLAGIGEDKLKTTPTSTSIDQTNYYGEPITYQNYSTATTSDIDSSSIYGHTHLSKLPCSYRVQDEYESDDVITFDWGGGSVGDNVRKVMNGLMETEVDISKGSRGLYKEDNPIINMDMRHQEVRERRKVRDHGHKQALQEQLRVCDIQCRAKEMLKMEEEQRRKKEKKDEEAIRSHMAAIKRQMHHQKERERSLRIHLEKLEKENSKEMFVDKVKETNKAKKNKKMIRDEEEEKREAVCVSDKRQENVLLTKMELLKQFSELEIKETKATMKLLHCCFISWHCLVQQNVTKIRKATVVGEWRLLLRYWRVWRGVVKQSRDQMMASKAADQLRIEKRKMKMADTHYHYFLIRKCISAWRGLVTAGKLHLNTREQLINNHDRLTAYLMAMQDRPKTFGNEDMKRVENQEEEGTMRKTEGVELMNGSSEKKGIVVHQGMYRNVWSRAREHVDTLLMEGAKKIAKRHMEKELEDEKNGKGVVDPDHMIHRSNLGVSHDKSHDQKPESSEDKIINQSHQMQSKSHTPQMNRLTKPTRKIPTKPVELKGMKERTVLIAERRQAREERKKRKEEERMAELKAEEEKRILEEKKAKETELKRKKEERRLAEEKELKRQVRVKQLEAMMKRAEEHYKHYLIQKKGMSPWLRFVTDMKEAWHLSVEKHRICVLRNVWIVWCGIVQKREMMRNVKVDIFNRKMRLQHSLKTWKQYVHHQHMLLEYALEMRTVLLVRRMFHGWERVTKEERIVMWENERRARKQHERYLVHSVFKAWQKYIPLSREEQKREVRRAELRRKVSQWLPDYKPSSTED